MRKYRTSKLFEKRTKHLRGKELSNLFSRIDEILNCEHVDHYKNLRKPLQNYKRVHVNKSFALLFYEEQSVIFFVDYAHHDEVYK